jgi:outer membrane protein OmpA-like peptidoglycan-associated protein
MKYTALILLAAFIITPFVITGCDSLTLDDPKVAKLEAKMDKLIKAHEQLKEQVKSYHDANIRLQNENVAALAYMTDIEKENAELRGQVTSLNGIIENMEAVVAIPIVPAITKQRHVIKFAHNQLYNIPRTKAAAKAVLAFAAKHNGKVKITIEGYSSKAGKSVVNKWFSKERAEGVMHKIYEAHNNDDLDLEVIAHGETDDNERMVIVTVEVLE